jgi:basic amino acid/polyamine antiporter, APA family
VIMAETTLQPPRTMFAWSFDGIAPTAITKVTRRGVPITATALTVAFSIACYAWAIYVAGNFFRVLVYATLIQLITHVLISVSSIVFPYRRPDLYRASVATHEVAGIPLMVVAGVGALCTTVFIYWAYFHYPFFGLIGHKGNMVIWLVGAVLFGLAWYAGARMIRGQGGVNLDSVYAEIPPE